MSYDDESKNNNEMFLKILKETRPELSILFNLLEDGKINLAIIINFIYVLNKIISGSGYGKITVDIQENQVTFIRGEEIHKLIEPIINEK